MIGPIGSFAIAHVIGLVAGGVALVAGFVMRDYGRRLERRTEARGRQLIE